MQESGPPRHGGEWADAEVVARVRGGEREAYALLVRRYQDLLYRYALRMTGQPDTAADLVQSAFVKAYAQLEGCRDPGRFGAWVFRIAANACRDHLKSGRRRDVSLEHTSSIRSAADPAADLERAELRRVLQGALERLPLPQREAFVLKHVEGRSYEEMAELLQEPVPALKMRVHRARQALKAMLEEVL